MQTKEEKIQAMQEISLKEAPYGYNKDGSIRLIPKRNYYSRAKPVRKNIVSQAKLGNVIDFITMWAIEINDEENIRLKLKPMVPMNIKQACREAGMNYQRFYQMLNADLILKKQFELFRENKQNYMKSAAEDNIFKGIEGELGLDWKELTDLSLKLLERTDKTYNPKVEIEQTIKNLSFNIDLNELQRQFNDIVKL